MALCNVFSEAYISASWQRQVCSLKVKTRLVGIHCASCRKQRATCHTEREVLQYFTARSLVGFLFFLTSGDGTLKDRDNTVQRYCARIFFRFPSLLATHCTEWPVPAITVQLTTHNRKYEKQKETLHNSSEWPVSLIVNMILCQLMIHAKKIRIFTMHGLSRFTSFAFISLHNYVEFISMVKSLMAHIRFRLFCSIA